MSKEVKQEKPKKERPVNYNEKLTVNGSFMDVMRAAAKDASKKNAQKKA